MREELANTAIHALGLALAVAGLATLVVRTSGVWAVVSASLYGGTLVALYAASTAYHATAAPGLKRVLRVLDHAAIYLLIAGTYTPFLLVRLRGPWGWSLFGVVWGLALLGVGFTAATTGRFDRLSTALYVAMGWLVVIAARPMVSRLPAAALWWLIAGGLVYTAGVYFYLRDHKPWRHAIWHGFVLAGSICHFAAVIAAIR